VDERDMKRFENQAAETVGAMKELFAEFEKRLGEVLAGQRVAASEASAAGAKAAASLQSIAIQGQTLVQNQRAAIEELRGGWKLHVAENSKKAGEEMARSFGTQIAEGAVQRLEKLGDAFERVARHFEWTAAVKWGLIGFFGSLALVALAAMMFINAVTPQADGLTDLQVRAAVARLGICQVGQQSHVCMLVDDKVLAGPGANGKGMVVIRGM
jgi:hypothetical protein